MVEGSVLNLSRTMDRKNTTDRPGNINLCQLTTDPGKPIIFCLRSLFSNLRVRHQEALRQLKLTTAVPTLVGLFRTR